MSLSIFKFTTARLTQCTCPPDKGYIIYWDETLKGLGLKVYPSSKKMFIHQSRLSGKVIKISLGTFPNCTIDQARQIAKEYDLKISQGIDPRLDKKKKIAQNELENKEFKRKKLRFGDIWSTYLQANQSRWVNVPTMIIFA